MVQKEEEEEEAGNKIEFNRRHGTFFSLSKSNI